MVSTPNFHVDIFNNFEKIVERIDSEDKELYILGDLNCDVSAENKNNNTKSLRNIVNDYNLDQLIMQPTRITSTTKTIIDLIYTNRPDRVVCSGVS